MAITDESGQPVDVAALNQEFARSQLSLPTETVAPAPPKRPSQPRSAAKPAPSKVTRAAAKKDASKVVSAPSPATPKLHEKRTEAGASVMHQLAMASKGLNMLTGNDAWNQDALVYASSADMFGEACAELAAKSPSFAKWLDSEGTTSGAYIGFGIVTASIFMRVSDNHPEFKKTIPGYFKKGMFYAKMATKRLGIKGKKK